jgi:hypothetical protein
MAAGVAGSKLYGSRRGCLVLSQIKLRRFGTGTSPKSQARAIGWAGQNDGPSSEWRKTEDRFSLFSLSLMAE